MAFIHLAGGTAVSVAAAWPATNDAAGYAALTWVAFGDPLASCDMTGLSYSTQVHQPLNGQPAVNMSHSPVFGTITPTVARVDGDSAQGICDTAALAYSAPETRHVSIKIVFPDAGVYTSRIEYYSVEVAGRTQLGLDSPGSVEALSYAMNVSGAPVVVAAVLVAPGP